MLEASINQNFLSLTENIDEDIVIIQRRKNLEIVIIQRRKNLEIVIEKVQWQLRMMNHLLSQTMLNSYIKK